ncbi:unnamed protein product [Blepharisma stoltei]|uniref:Ubiquitin-like protease family profile domain-containing protein n=1 Tax=Blepharisma stoltei TaxID=1481888 RepID=A0AAU9JT03_9CILI|nr:unnamed protein product [Blepharisma stoltei]
MDIEVFEIDSSSDDSEKENICNYSNDPVIMTYKIKSCIPIKESDYSRLNPKQYLNDNVVDFFLLYFLNESERKSIHVFNSFFYKTLENDGYEKIAKWVNEKEIFDKDYWVIPLAINNHWVLLVVCYPKCIFLKNRKGKQKRPQILLFDSLNIIEEDLGENVRYFIANAWATLNNEDYCEIPEKEVPLIAVRVPQQENLFDCGVYLIFFAKVFMRAPTKFDSANTKKDFSDLFKIEEIERGRWELKNIINQYSSGERVNKGVNIFLSKSLLKDYKDSAPAKLRRIDEDKSVRVIPSKTPTRQRKIKDGKASKVVSTRSSLITPKLAGPQNKPKNNAKASIPASPAPKITRKASRAARNSNNTNQLLENNIPIAESPAKTPQAKKSPISPSTKVPRKPPKATNNPDLQPSKARKDAPKPAKTSSTITHKTSPKYTNPMPDKKYPKRERKANIWLKDYEIDLTPARNLPQKRPRGK